MYSLPEQIKLLNKAYGRARDCQIENLLHDVLCSLAALEDAKTKLEETELENKDLRRKSKKTGYYIRELQLEAARYKKQLDDYQQTVYYVETHYELLKSVKSADGGIDMSVPYEIKAIPLDNPILLYSLGKSLFFTKEEAIKHASEELKEGVDEILKPFCNKWVNADE